MQTPTDDLLHTHERLAALLSAAPYRYATTMQHNPHHYTLRRYWNDDDFEWAVKTIREHGYTRVFAGRPYTQYDINGYYYWTMGDPIPETILINRKPRETTHEYDSIAHKYDLWWKEPEYVQQDLDLMEAIDAVTGPADNLNVLSIGSGPGTYLTHRRPRSCLTIDPSAGMLETFRHHHQDQPFMHTTIEAFAPPRGARYDLILALYGTASYFTLEDHQKLKRLLKPEGVAILMYYTEEPITHQRAKRRLNWKPHNPEEHEGTPEPFGEYTFVTLRP